MKKSVSECKDTTFRIVKAIATQMNIIMPGSLYNIDKKDKWHSLKKEIETTIWREFEEILPKAITYQNGDTDLLLNDRMHLQHIFIKDNMFDNTIKLEVSVFDNKYRTKFNQTIDQIIYLFCNPNGVYALESAIIQLL